jgi:KaiC/GvpD/RAD55 family RecA-like ATPase
MTEQVNEGIEYTYKLMKGGDGHLYVSIQPLMKDVAASVAKMHTMDVSHLSDEQQRIFDLKMLGLTTVYEFLGSFVTEQQLKDAAAELKGTVPLNVTDNYNPIGDGFNVKQ